MKMQELKSKSQAELSRLLTEQEQRLLSVRMELASRQSTNHAQVSKIRRTIARIKTLQNTPEEVKNA